VNWYKKSQVAIDDYTDIGHWWNTPGDIEEIGEKMITLWMSDISGENFQTMKIHPNDPDTHQELFPVQRNYWGRHDPFTNTSSINIPYFSDQGYNQLGPDDIPNRLVKKLENEFPHTSIWAFPYRSNPVQIV